MNGCQTSNILFRNREYCDETVTVMLKIVQTSDADVVENIVRSTNRQSKVDEHQFLATLDIVKQLERYFDARGANSEYRIFFERRRNQYSSLQDAKDVRVFDVREVARCVAAMFLDKPDIASRYPHRLTGEMRELVFKPGYKEEIFYVAAYTAYRFRMLYSNNKVDAKYGKLRWHVLMAIKYFLFGENIPALNSPKILKCCIKIEQFMSGSNEETIDILKRLCGSIVDIEEVDRDKIRSASFVQDVRQRVLRARPELIKLLKT